MTKHCFQYLCWIGLRYVIWSLWYFRGRTDVNHAKCSESSKKQIKAEKSKIPTYRRYYNLALNWMSKASVRTNRTNSPCCKSNDEIAQAKAWTTALSAIFDRSSSHGLLSACEFHNCNVPEKIIWFRWFGHHGNWSAY